MLHMPCIIYIFLYESSHALIFVICIIFHGVFFALILHRNFTYISAYMFLKIKLERADELLAHQLCMN